MKRIANPIETTELCSYGCGNIAKFINGSKKLMCCKSSNSCPANKKKNSEKCKAAYDSGKRLSGTQQYELLPNESKEKMCWAKGLTKETNVSLASTSAKLSGRPGISRPLSDAAKKKLSIFRTQWLKNPENRKNLGRQNKSWMELMFEQYLKNNNVIGWDAEVHFWNDELRKNYFVDFIFECKKLIIELDGTQHQKTIIQDQLRDRWFTNKGYKVVRITHDEFKKRLFSGAGFLDLIS